MKEVKAYVKPHKLSQVTLALRMVEGLTGMSVVDVRGFGRSRAKRDPQRTAEELADYVPYVKIEIVCLDDLVEEVISVIKQAAYTSLRGDGKIYVSNVETAIRIETGECGEGAV
jgi:nitrogen regulatory protein PII